MTFGVKFSASEVDDAFAEMKIDEVTYFVIIISIILVIMTNLITITAILIAGHDRRCPPEGPDGVEVKCSMTQTRGELAHHHKQFRPRVQKQPTTTTATDPHFTTTHQASCNIPNGWEQTSAVWQMLTKSPADSLFSKFKSVRLWSGGHTSPRSIMISNWARNYLSSDLKNVPPLSFLSLDYLPSSGRLSSPGQKIFF